MYAVMEFGGESLFKKYYRKGVMAVEDIKRVMSSVAAGVDHLHTGLTGNEIVIHRDIRSDNVTVSEKGVYKIIDFGISSKKSGLDSAIVSQTNWGNVLWKSPEYCRYIISRDFQEQGV